MAYQMTAERENEKAQSRNESLFIVVAKARVWASEGWQVVVTDDAGRTFTPDDFDELSSLDTRSLDAKFLDAKFPDAKTPDADPLDAEDSPLEVTESVDEQDGELQDADGPEKSDGASEEGIGHPLLADTGAGTVPADETNVVAERQQFFRDRLDKGGVTAAGDVAAADRAIEKYIANMGKPHLPVKEHDAAG